MLVFSHVSRYYPNGLALFRDMSFYVHPGDVVCFVGPAHSGKSRLLKLMMGFEHPTAGTVLFQRWNWSRLSVRQRARLHRDIGVMGSPVTLLAKRTVWENLALPLVLRGFSGKTLKNRIESTLLHLELYDRAKDYVESLSWSEQYRLSLGRAFIHRPLLVLADTPLTCFREEEERFFEWIGRLRSSETALICTETQPMRYAERVYMLSSEQWINPRR